MQVAWDYEDDSIPPHFHIYYEDGGTILTIEAPNTQEMRIKIVRLCIALDNALEQAEGYKNENP